jgi:coenzyme F420 hydrogenase subunit beta
MKLQPTINFIVKNNLCTGCGICQDACPQTAISFQVKNGLNTPVIQSEYCTNSKSCSRCYDVCPGKGIGLNKLGKELYGDRYSSYDYYIGYYNSCYSGYSLNQDIRFHSASGGLLSQFLIYLLEKEIISGAVVTGFENKDLMKPYSYIATTKQEILNARSSKYCPVSLNGMASQLIEKEGKFIVVGLPCHIHGFRNLEKKDKKLKSKIQGYFAIYCSSTRNFYAQQYIAKRYNIERNKLKYFAYRDDGCLGYLKAEHVDGRTVKVGFRTYYHSLRSFFKPRRCLSCIDHYGELADVSFGDIQVGDYRNDEIGVNSLVVRNYEFDKLLKRAAEEAHIKIEIISHEIVNESQKVMLRHKRSLSYTVMLIDKMLFKKNPLYDITLHSKSGGIKPILSLMSTHLQRYIGRSKKLWFIIDFFGNRKA